jgi:uncharacterized phage-like protein YoqJ
MKLPWGMNEADPRCIELKAELASILEAAYGMGYRNFICGMAIGCDMYFAEAVLALREQHPDVHLEAAIPCGGQSEKWNKKDRLRYNKLIDSANEVNVLQIQYTPDCMMKRNFYMVDKSSLLIACFDGRPGGTMKTILYAQRQGLRTLICDVN